jgi:hypothetical protein
MKKLITALTAFAFVLAATPSLATTRVMKLAEDRYLITHQKQTSLGGQGKAMRRNYEKAGSLCVVLGYRAFEIKEMQSKGRSWGGGAAATMEVKFYHEQDVEGHDLLSCQDLATKEQEEKMKKALQKAK